MPKRFGRIQVWAIAIVAWLFALPDGRLRSEAASIMIWPLNPVVRSDDRATAVWIENRGRAPVTLQIRVLRWEVEDYREHYVEQQDAVVGSPPIATIAPGQRQLVRLMRIGQPQAGTEAAYRVLIDELPSPTGDTKASPSAASLGVMFRMRYSLPLFLYGEGLSPIDRRARDQIPADLAPRLSWRVVSAGGRRWLQVHNTGTHHARLTDVRLTATGASFEVAAGLLGYALPGKVMRWPIAADIPDDPSLVLEARINGRPSAVIPRH